MALSLRATLERFARVGEVFAVSPNWLPGLDKLRNWLRDSESLFRGIAQLKAMESLLGQFIQVQATTVDTSEASCRPTP